MVDGITYRNITARHLGEMIQVTLNYHTGLKPTNRTATPVLRNVLIEDCTFTGGSSGSGGITMSFSGARGSVVFSRGVIGPTAGPGLPLEDHTVGSAVAVFDR